MRKFTFESVEDCEKIFLHHDTVVFTGKHPWIFRKDGTYIAKIKGISRAYQMTFLPNQTVFMDGAGDKSYHYVSLDTGEVLWSIPKKGRRNLPPQRMTVSPDGGKIYYLSCVGSDFGAEYIDTIVPEARSITTQKSPLYKGTVRGFWCNADGNLSMLRRVVCSNDFQLFQLDAQSLEIISCQEFKAISNSNDAVTSNDTYILFDDWKVYAIKTGEMFSLLANEQNIVKKNRFVVDGYDPDRKLLTVHYLDHGSTLIIDCKNRKIAAHYRPISNDLRSGRLIDNEFWIGTYDGIVKRPFPYVDPFPHGFFADT
jgi:hypothetical protein